VRPNLAVPPLALSVIEARLTHSTRMGYEKHVSGHNALVDGSRSLHDLSPYREACRPR
jgi:hypothetical protein